MQNLDNAIRYNLKPLLSKYFITKWSGDNTLLFESLYNLLNLI